MRQRLNCKHMTEFMTLAQLPVGRGAVIRTMPEGQAGLTRLREMGLVPGARVEMVRRAPFGEPIEVRRLGPAAVTPRIAVAQIVGHDHDEVRRQTPGLFPGGTDDRRADDAHEGAEQPEDAPAGGTAVVGPAAGRVFLFSGTNDAWPAAHCH